MVDDGTYGAPGVLPQVAAAMSRDPRFLLAQSMSQTGQDLLHQPTYSPWAALAKALTIGSGGATTALLQNEYQKANQGALSAMQNAAQAAQPTMGANGQAQPPDAARINAALSGNPYTLPMALQNQITLAMKNAEPYNMRTGETRFANNQPVAQGAPNDAVAQLQTQLARTDPNDPMYGTIKARIAQLTTTPEGVQFTGNGAIPAPGVAQSQSQNILGTSGAKATAAGAVTAATSQAALPAEAKKAALGTFLDSYKAIVDRFNGQVLYPALEKPEMVQGLMTGLNLTPADLQGAGLGNLIPGHNGRTALGAPGGATQPPPAANPIPPPAGNGQIRLPMLGGTTSGLTPPPLSATGGPPAAPGASSAPGATSAQPVPAAPPGAALAAPAASQAPPAAAPPVAPGSGANKFEGQVPHFDLPSPVMKGGAGTIVQGRDPGIVSSNEKAIDAATKQKEEVDLAAKAGGDVHAQLGTIRTLLNSGGLVTSATGDTRKTIADYLYAFSGHDSGAASLAQRLTGIDPTQSDVFTKEATRLGFSLSRAQGAREAAQVVQFAIKANPNLLNTTEGNKMVTNLLDAGAQHDIDAQQWMQASLKENGHYVNAADSFNAAHPPAEYTSKVMPYDLPRLQSGAVDPAKLQPNVTYNIQSGKHTGPAVWRGNGFEPVQQ